MASPPALTRVFGPRDGTPALYFHGAPGAPVEAELIAGVAEQQGVALCAVSRADIPFGGGSADYLDRLAEVVARLDGGRRLPILGFSIGAALALRVAARLKADAGPLLLLSAAGPLDVPGAFDGMGAGARVFRSAQAGGAGFAMTVAAQALLARRAPGLLRRMLFAGAASSDRALAASPDGQALLARIYAGAWAGGGHAYRRDLTAYVEPWAADLDAVTAPVELWHGTDDNWAPVAMARGIARRLPAARLHEAEGGHYATLIAQAPRALAGVAGVD